MRGTFTMRVQPVLVAIALFFSFDLSFGQTKKLRPLHIALANHSVHMDQAGFDGMEFFVSGRFKKVVRKSQVTG